MDETTIIKGRSPRTATLLLAAAAQLEQDKRVVRTTMGGYRVPTDVAERYAELDAELTKADAKRAKPQAPVETPAVVEPPQETKAPAKRTAAKKTAARKTATAKKTTATAAKNKES